jgi:hypothetical protein
MSLLPDRGPPGPLIFMPLSPLGERLGEGVMQEEAFGLTPSPNLPLHAPLPLGGEAG